MELFKNVQNAQVSDTTKIYSSNTAKSIKEKKLSLNE